MEIGIECIPHTMLDSIHVREDAFWMHIDDEDGHKRAIEVISEARFDKNVRVVFVSGYESESVHDAIDDAVEGRNGDLILTVWGDEGFRESLWEFVEVHALQPYINSAKILIISRLSNRRIDLLKTFIDSPQVK